MKSEDLLVASGALALVALLMVGETLISWRHTRRLRQLGAVEPPGDIYPLLVVAYPAAFVAMAVEGAAAGVAGAAGRAAGAVLFGLAKALKYWAMAALGERWTFRVLVLPGRPLVAHGPYRWFSHPNYLAVGGELLGMALAMRARVAGPVAVVAFGLLLWRRVLVEERALGLRR